ncbi:hypothetical protein Tsp_01386, partial [Trichinella spiralis]
RGQRPINEQWNRMGTEVGPSGTIPTCVMSLHRRSYLRSKKNDEYDTK